jgi:hypothetical protein
MIRSLIVFLTVVQLSLIVRAEVSYASIKGFWEAAYDTDQDGEATIDDFIKFFNLMEPEHGISRADC